MPKSEVSDSETETEISGSEAEAKISGLVTTFKGQFTNLEEVKSASSEAILKRIPTNDDSIAFIVELHRQSIDIEIIQAFILRALQLQYNPQKENAYWQLSIRSTRITSLLAYVRLRRQCKLPTEYIKEMGIHVRETHIDELEREVLVPRCNILRTKLKSAGFEMKPEPPVFVPSVFVPSWRLDAAIQTCEGLLQSSQGLDKTVTESVQALISMNCNDRPLKTKALDATSQLLRGDITIDAYQKIATEIKEDSPPPSSRQEIKANSHLDFLSAAEQKSLQADKTKACFIIGGLMMVIGLALVAAGLCTGGTTAAPGVGLIKVGKIVASGGAVGIMVGTGFKFFAKPKELPQNDKEREAKAIEVKTPQEQSIKSVMLQIKDGICSQSALKH